MTLGHFDTIGNFIIALNDDAECEEIYLAISFARNKMTSFVPFAKTAFALVVPEDKKQLKEFLTARCSLLK